MEFSCFMKIFRISSVYILISVILFSVSIVSQTVQNKSAGSAIVVKSEGKVSSDLDEIKSALQAQQAEIAKLQLLVAAQAEVIARLEKSSENKSVSNSPLQNSVAATQDSIESRLAKVEDQTKKSTESIARNQLGNLGFSGDLRMQYDSQYGLLNNAANVNNPAILGNELSSRQRIRYRLRFAIRGKMGGDVFTGAFASNGDKRTDKEFEWGFRFSSGTLAQPASPNPVLTDFFSRKPVAIDQAFVSWRPRPAPGLRVIAGKFDPTWSRTEMTIDNDVQVEGVSEVYSRDLKNSVVKNITFSAWQLPLLERGTTFVRNANGTINIEESNRGGRDLGLFGAQLQARFALSKNTNLTLAVANQHFANTDAINPVQVFGSNLQLPVTITIPATATTPSQTVTGVANVPREFLLSGNGNLGLSNTTNAAINRNGRLASRFNLIDLLAQFDIKHFKYNPITMIFDYVRNTATRDVIVAGPGGADLALPNNENQGIWGEFRIQSLRKNRGSDFSAPVKGDVLLSYTYLRIEKDAVFSGFNWDDLIQPSDILGHRLFLSYTADPRVTFNITGLFNKRLNGLLGPFSNTPAGSLDKMVTRLQFDTVFKF